MLRPTRVRDTGSSQRLIKLWMGRYLPDLSLLATEKNESAAVEMVETASAAGRSKTVEKVMRSLQLNCEMAGVQTNSLFSYVPNVVNLSEARQIAVYVESVYRKTLEIYQQQEPPSLYLRYVDFSSNLFAKLALPSLMLPMITTLATALEPVLLKLQAQHSVAKDVRTLGFMTTQFHFSTRQLLKKLTVYEQILLLPYLKFVEEQVCVPWQRLCAAAAQHEANSPLLAIVEQLLPLSHEIANNVYKRGLQRAPMHCSRRGTLSNPEVAMSTLRDLNMFQGYLWLCVLEESMNAIEHELLPLCMAVFPNVDVKWSLVELMIELLEEEILSRTAAAQKALLTPYMAALRKLFAISETAEAQMGELNLLSDSALKNLVGVNQR